MCSTKNKTVPHVIRILKIYSMMQPRVITGWRHPSFADMVKNNTPFLTSKRVSYVFSCKIFRCLGRTERGLYSIPC